MLRLIAGVKSMGERELNEAVLLAIGTWRSDTPRIDVDRLDEAFGVDQGKTLGIRVQSLARELLSQDGGPDPVGTFADEHPELSREALAALSWWYTANFHPDEEETDAVRALTISQ